MRDRIEAAIPGTWGVILWVGVSAGLTAIATYVLSQPDLIKYYGVANIVLYFLYEVKKAK